MKTILVPLDFSEVTARVMQTTIDLARTWKSKVILLHVVPPPIVMTAYGMADEPVSEAVSREGEQARKELESCRDELTSQGIDTTILTVQGPTVESILHIAQENSADLLVMGSHGHGAFYEFIVGSTTRGVLKEFPRPVMLVPSRVPAKSN